MAKNKILYLLDHADKIKHLLKTCVMAIYPALMTGNIMIILPMLINHIIDSLDLVIKYIVGEGIVINREKDYHVERYLAQACKIDNFTGCRGGPWPEYMGSEWEKHLDSEHIVYINDGSIKLVVKTNTMHFYGNHPEINSIIDKCQELYNPSQVGFEFEINIMNNSQHRCYMHTTGMYNRDTVPSHIYDSIDNKISKFLQSEDRYKDLQIPWKTGFIFQGSVGTGKTLVAMDLARHYGLKLVKFNDMNKFMLTYNSLKPRTVILFDDVDMILDYNRETDDKNVNEKHKAEVLERKKKLKQLMDIFDGYYSLHGCILILITNYIDKIDPALIRPGRLDHHIEFGNLPYETVISTLKKYYGQNIDIPSELKHIQIKISVLMTNYIIPNLDDYGQCIADLLQYIDKNK